MPILQKQNVVLKTDLLLEAEGGIAIPGSYFQIDEDGNLVIPGATGATVLKSGIFTLDEHGNAFIATRHFVPAPAGHIALSGDAALIDPAGNLMIPNRLVPSARTIIARERGVVNNLLLKAHGGVGDIVCSEPAIRFAVERFSDQKISLCTDYPEFFQHLKFEKIYPASGPNIPDYTKYLLFQNFSPGDELAWEFVSHPLTHAVDYASLNMWRCMLPADLKTIRIVPTEAQKASMRAMFPLGFLEHNGPIVAVHPGKTWDSRTFPKHWWDAVLTHLKKSSIIPILIGGDVDVVNGKARASTVDVETEGTIDMRGKLSFIETVALLQESQVLLTNDSCPLHMAASGRAWIGFCSTVKHPDHLLHWRNGGAGEFGWRMTNFAEGNLFESINFCPNQEKAINVDQININELLKWLPRPEEFAAWAIGKCKPYNV